MSEREWKFCIDDMFRFAEKVLAYSAGLDQTQFEDDELRHDAVVRNLELHIAAITLRKRLLNEIKMLSTGGSAAFYRQYAEVA